MQTFNSIRGAKKRLVSSIVFASLVGAETLMVLTSARALDLQSRQDLQAVGSYRCADSDGKNLVRVRLTEKNGVPNNLSLNYGNGVVENLEVSDSSKKGSGQAYTAYSANSNQTVKFIEYPNGKGRLITSLEKPNGEQDTFGTPPQRCFKIG